MRYIFLIAACFLYTGLYSQSRTVEKIIGLTKFSLNQRLESAEYNHVEAAKKKLFEPISISYSVPEPEISNETFKDNIIYFNLDSLGKVSSVILELINSKVIIEKLKQELGDFTSRTKFNIGNSNTECKGWVMPAFCLLLLTTDNLNLLIYYNCNTKSFL